jgi:FkbM family methyltransferase
MGEGLNRDTLSASFDASLSRWMARPWAEPGYDRLTEWLKCVRQPALFCKVLYQRFINKPIIVNAQTFWGTRVKVTAKNEIWLWSMPGAKADIALTEFLIKTINHETVFFDVGANCGFFSRLALELGCRELHAFEPVPFHFRLLQENVRDERAHLNNKALYTRPGGIDINATAGGESSIYTAFKKSKKIFIDTVRLDDYSRDIRPDLIKIDVEGAEADVIKGGLETLKKYSPKIVMEIGAKESPLYPLHLEAIDLLKSIGYRPFRLMGEPMDDIVPERDIPPIEGFGNFLFTA